MGTSTNRTIPLSLKPLFWSNNFSTLDPEKDRKTIVIQTINYGSLEDWKWLIEKYGRREVRSILIKIPVTEIRERAKRLAAIIFSISEFNYAPRGSR